MILADLKLPGCFSCAIGIIQAGRPIMIMNKYRNKPTIIDNHRFPSKREARRYQELRLLESAGEIRNLLLQKKYVLVVEGEHITDYFADFEYEVVATGEICTEDTKGFATREYKMKKKLVKALYGVSILEV